MDSHTNFAYSLVATAPSPATSGTSLVVTGGQGVLFPTPPFNVTIWPAGVSALSTNAEIARVTAISTDTFTITRSQESSAARTIVAGDQIAATITVKTLTDVESYSGLVKTDGSTPLTANWATGNFDIQVGSGRLQTNIIRDSTGGNNYLVITGTSPNQASVFGGSQFLTLTDAISANSTSKASWTVAGTEGMKYVSGGSAAAGALSILAIDTRVTSIDKLILSNNTPATAAIPVQYSGGIQQSGAAWNTTATAATNPVNMRQDLRPVSGATVSSVLGWAFQINGGGYTDRMTLTSAGTLTTTSAVLSGTLTMGGSNFQTDGLILVRTGSTGTTIVDKISLSNATAATSGVPQQYSGGFLFTTNAWTGSTPQVANFRLIAEGINGTTPITAKLIIQSQINAAGFNDRYTFDDAGNLTVSAKIISPLYVINGGGTFTTAGNDQNFAIQTRGFSTAVTALQLLTGTMTHSTGAFVGVSLTPTYNQTGASAATDLLINRTETAVGSGAQNFIDLQASTVSKFKIANTGKVTLGNTLTLKGYTVSTLPTGTQGDIAFVTDALTPTFLVTAVGGGAVVSPVFYNGSSWVTY